MNLRFVLLTTAATAAAAALAAGCDAEMPGAGDDDGDAPDAGPPPPPTIQYGYDGTYTLDETLDLSAPFGLDGVGGVIADTLIEQAVELAGVPGPLQDDARDLV